MADQLVQEPPNKRPKLSDNADFVFGKSLVWNLENELPDELIETPIDPDLPQSSHLSVPQNLFNGTNETVSVEGSVILQRHQQLSQLLQAKSTQQSHTSLSSSQQIPSPSVTSITSVKIPLTNNVSVNKSATAVSSTAHINLSDVSTTLTNISNSTVNSLSNTSGIMGMNSNMLLLQSKSGALSSQGNLVTLTTSIANNSNTGNLQHSVTVVPSQLTQQQSVVSLMNGNLMSHENANTLSINRGINSNISSAVLVQHSPHHQNLLGNSLINQGATLKVIHS